MRTLDRILDLLDRAVSAYERALLLRGIDDRARQDLLAQEVRQTAASAGYTEALAEKGKADAKLAHLRTVEFEEAREKRR